jgi:tRNA (cmo5U34)-methyltransferase
VRDVFLSTVDGGAFVLVEKVLGSTAESDAVLVAAYYDTKREAGYTDEEIDRKRLSLEGVLVPVTARWNEDMLSRTGFRDVECIWRTLNFAAWVAVK